MLVIRSLGGDAPPPAQTTAAPQVVEALGAGNRRLEAAAIVAVSVGSASALILHATGHSREAYAFGAAGILMGGAIAAVRLLAGRG